MATAKKMTSPFLMFLTMPRRRKKFHNASRKRGTRYRASSTLRFAGSHRMLKVAEKPAIIGFRLSTFCRKFFVWHRPYLKIMQYTESIITERMKPLRKLLSTLPGSFRIRFPLKIRRGTKWIGM